MGTTRIIPSWLFALTLVASIATVFGPLVLFFWCERPRPAAGSALYGPSELPPLPPGLPGRAACHPLAIKPYPLVAEEQALSWSELRHCPHNSSGRPDRLFRLFGRITRRSDIDRWRSGLCPHVCHGRNIERLERQKARHQLAEIALSRTALSLAHLPDHLFGAPIRWRDWRQT